MRHLLLVGCISLIAAAAGSAHAQVERTGVMVYAGLTRATLHGDSVPGPLHTTGFIGGAAISWHLVDRFALQPELQFVQKGDDETDAFGGGVISEHIRLNYIEVPVLLRASGDAVHGVTPFVIGGPQVAFKTSCSIDVKGVANNYTCADFPPAESTEFGVVAGGGVDAAVMGHAISVSARYDWGLRDAFKNNLAKTRTLAVLLGWRVR